MFNCCTLTLGVSVSSPVVSSVSPSKIGLGGGVVTIEGAGFSEDVFNQFDPVLGNKVILIKSKIYKWGVWWLFCLGLVS